MKTKFITVTITRPDNTDVTVDFEFDATHPVNASVLSNKIEDALRAIRIPGLLLETTISH